MPKRWVTADLLAKRLKTGVASGVVELAADEFLTPNAADLADMRHVAVKRVAAGALPKAPDDTRDATAAAVDAKAAASARSGAISIGVVLDRASELVRTLVAGMYRDGAALVDFATENCWIRNTRSLCAAVTAGQVAGGVIVRPWAAEAVMLANKAPGVRAVQGTGRAAVAAAMRQFQANVLVVEQSTATFHEIRVLLAAFAAGLAAANATNPLLAAVADLEGRH